MNLRPYLPAVLIIAAFGAFVLLTLPNMVESEKQQRQAAQRQAAADAVPRLFSQADGCRVYTFRAGTAWHYFTVCAQVNTTTQRNYTVKGPGKHPVTTTHAETITTENQ